jgi:hypothetical protein
MGICGVQCAAANITSPVCTDNRCGSVYCSTLQSNCRHFRPVPCGPTSKPQPSFSARPPHPAAEQQWRMHCACVHPPALRWECAECAGEAQSAAVPTGSTSACTGTTQAHAHGHAHAHPHTHAWACGTHACAHARARSERYAHRSPRLGSVWCRVVGSAGSQRAPGTAGFDYLPPFWTPQLCEASCKCLPTASPTDMSTNSLQAPPSSRPSSRPASLPRPGPPSSPPSLPGSPTRLSTLVRKLPVSLPGSPG